MEGPYRAGKPLTELISPDRRRQRALLLVGGGMIAGAVLWSLAKPAFERPATVFMHEPPTITVTGHIKRTTLIGPDGAVTLPTGEKTIVHVWLQGCADCMPAFEAMKAIFEKGGLDADAEVVNVSYGEADATWAGKYGVRQGLVHDPAGASIVRPLGISSFTTLVIDGEGNVIHKDRPDELGYVERIQAVVGKGHRGTRLVPAPPRLTSDEVEVVVASHRSDLKKRCWDGRTSGPSSAKATMLVVVGPNGDVVSVEPSGSDALVASCVEAQIRTWRFPAHRERSGTISLPFEFSRE